MSSIAEFVRLSGFVVYGILALVFFLIGNVSLRFDGFNKGIKQALVCYGITIVWAALALVIHQLRKRATATFDTLALILALPGVVIAIAFVFILLGGLRLILPSR